MIDTRLNPPKKRFFLRDKYLIYDHSQIDDSKIEKKDFSIRKEYKEYLYQKKKIELKDYLSILKSKIEKNKDPIEISEYLYYSKIYYEKYSKN